MAGLAAVIAGLLLAAFAVARIRPDAALLAAAVLGAGYGLCVAYGLTEVAALAPPDGLARLTARFWALCYLGFCTPYAITLLTGLFAPATVLLAMVVPAAATLALIARRVPAGAPAGCPPHRLTPRPVPPEARLAPPEARPSRRARPPSATTGPREGESV
ncbi:hypothetical protein O1L68_22260 [Streptomyces lydicus]|nr:hypothetical protein [Streptomyces lydicus]